MMLIIGESSEFKFYSTWSWRPYSNNISLSNVYIFDTMECSKNIRANYNLRQFTNKASSLVVIV